MVCTTFLTWMLCSMEERAEISHLFETDMHGDKFYQLSLTAGGDKTDEIIMEIVRHSSKMGYMDFI